MADKKPLKKKKAAASSAPEGEDVADASSAARAPEKKKRFRLVQILGVLLIVAVLSIIAFFWYVFYGPRYGTIHYGICRVFAERYVTYPSTFKVRDAEYYRTAVRVYVTHIDASGQYRYDNFECLFTPPSFEITSARLNRDPIPQKIVDQFNVGIDTILASPPSLRLPPALRNATLNELWHGEYDE